ncbi:MAG: pantoate--beta-alanine ligase [Desulfobulbaceae bacterium]|nr:pantoate--beta-alanine ligase [Desulfobulbaceae bacterium]
MEIITATKKMSDWTRDRQASGKSVALVPTMGYFHDGHLSLMRQAKALADLVVVSLFVNPIQFGPSEDLTRYPRNLDRDMQLAKGCGVDILFVPTLAEIYPELPLTRIAVPSLSDRLCGLSRPGHFDGVCTVVGKLFNIVRPTTAIFGSKDFQQLAVIRRMTSDLNWGVEIVAHPIVRESDGLAMSSRNSYLSVSERATATCLYRAIGRARELVAAGESEVARILAEVKKVLTISEEVCIDYTAVVSAASLESQLQVGCDSLLALAVRVGGTRLIDNAMLMEKSG